MSEPTNKQSFSLVGNLGLTTLTMIPAATALYQSSRPYVAMGLAAALLGLFIYDILAYLRPRHIAERGRTKVGDFPRALDDQGR